MYVQNWNINLALPLMAKNNIEIFFHVHIICTFYKNHTHIQYIQNNVSTKKNYTNYIYKKFVSLPAHSFEQDSFIKIWQQTLC